MVSARTAGEIIQISIQDDGIGIPQDVDINHATSLGLKLIRSLVLQLKGTLTIESTQRGTNVKFEFSPETGG
jgi:two-component sensor histidine kinase